MEMKVAKTKEEVLKALKDGRKVTLKGHFPSVYDCVITENQSYVIASRENFKSIPLTLSTFASPSRLERGLFTIEAPSLPDKEEKIYKQLLALTDKDHD